MADGIIRALALPITLIAAVFAFKIIMFFIHFGQGIQYLRAEMRRAVDDEEYRYWRRELRCHFLCLIPFVNEKNAARVYDFFFHDKKEKAHNGKGHTNRIFMLLAPSAIGLCSCIICLCGASWAWFTASTAAQTSTMKSPEYSLSVSVTDGNGTSVSPINGSYSLDSGSYTVKLSADGTAGATGYCSVSVNNIVYYTEQIPASGTISFVIDSDGSTDISLTPKWGSCAVRTEENTLHADARITAYGSDDTSEASDTPILPQTPSQASASPTPQATQSDASSHTVPPEVSPASPETAPPETSAPIQPGTAEAGTAAHSPTASESQSTDGKAAGG